ncbi:DEP domain-containing mTOR-interacting protein isoform X2 [Dendropsophus ebraccatus]|uniref:DEP domain-containing mTOR-interacting protein isoform X2 n=1 Tax=Dendropsophus ebraccatus TaxID=150705 RepID=UPI003831A5FE
MDALSMAVVKKVNEMEELGEVLLITEQLRLRFHEDKIIKDRRHNVSTYPNSFVAREAIDWIMDHKEAADRAVAKEIMQKLIDHNSIHHVCDKYKEFRDARLFYRFRRDDGTFPLVLEVRVIFRGQRLYEKVMNTDNSLLQAREEDGVTYERSFVASEFIDWLILGQEADARTDAEELGQRLLEHAVIQHVSGKHHFVDGNLLYQFRMNFRRRRRLMELLVKRPPSLVDSPDSPFCLRKQIPERPTNFLSALAGSEDCTISALRRCSLGAAYGGGYGGGYYSSSSFLFNSPPVALSEPKSVLKRPVTVEELLAPGAPYRRKLLTVISDPVGWGFVVRGEKPCHVQAVDPSGAAAAAGIKTCQFVVSINGRNVLNYDFKAIRSLILHGPRVIIMEVMEEITK